MSLKVELVYVISPVESESLPTWRRGKQLALQAKEELALKGVYSTIKTEWIVYSDEEPDYLQQFKVYDTVYEALKFVQSSNKNA